MVCRPIWDSPSVVSHHKIGNLNILFLTIKFDNQIFNYQYFTISKQNKSRPLRSIDIVRNRICNTLILG